MQVKVAVLILVKVHTPLHKLLNLLWSVLHHHTHNFLIAGTVTRNQRVFNVILKLISGLSHRCYTSLSQGCIGLLKLCFTQDGNLTLICHL